MPKVFTTVPGAVIDIGNFGRASNAAGIEVPERVARKLGAGFRVEREGQGRREGEAQHPSALEFGSSRHTRHRRGRRR
jgi:hypothetical protein